MDGNAAWRCNDVRLSFLYWFMLCASELLKIKPARCLIQCTYGFSLIKSVGTIMEAMLAWIVMPNVPETVMINGERSIRQLNASYRSRPTLFFFCSLHLVFCNYNNIVREYRVNHTGQRSLHRVRIDRIQLAGARGSLVGAFAAHPFPVEPPARVPSLRLAARQHAVVAENSRDRCQRQWQASAQRVRQCNLNTAIVVVGAGEVVTQMFHVAT